ncbi:zinc transport system substrate-binding protein [Neobacillus niacini]|jgi:zinc transport system substrate-binding protein|uniref:metal ABC transporter solute-binding protein, Zn/Mn family n=1 Tax=Neobacillus niacini TaxID=86668 RepID=UPI00277FC30D|nr:zinc ABC transporter substrate-binding protein [Neobacillus niacini]MDQ0999747.1 zinc transport system substrate-binding protein [Neobacillus niacini]
MKKKFITILSVLALMLFLAACNQTEKTQSSEDTKQLTVFTTIYPLQYFTERIGGDLVKIENIVPPGSDAHSVEISTKTMMKVAESDAFIHTGTGVEGFADSVSDSLEKEDVKIVSASENIDFISSNQEAHDEHAEEEGHDEHAEEEAHDEHNEEGHEEHGESDIDPHVWLDPNRSIILAENIKNALAELQPENKKAFEDNFITLKNELEKLDTEFTNMVAQTKTKTFIVSHSAYGYWENTYGLKQVGISGLSPTDEPSQKKLTEVIELVKENNLQYIFFEPNLTNKVAEIVQNETGTKALTLNNLESISDENIKKKEDYFVIMRKNIDSLKQALN